MTEENFQVTLSSKVALITNIPAPYRIPLWKELTKLCHLEVMCISKTESNRKWNTESVDFLSFLPSFHIAFPSRDWFLHFTFPFATLYRLLKINPEVVVITGYDSFAYWEALLYTKLFRKKTVFWNGSTGLSSKSTSRVVNRIKYFFIHNFDSYYTYGSLATEYLQSFGVNDKNIITGINTVDTAFFKNRQLKKRDNKENNNLLFVGQLIERKGLLNVIKALSLIETVGWSLTVIGEGAQRQELLEQVEEEGMSDKVHFLGYKDKSEIIKWYYASDILVMPSLTEVWGLVINEALSTGLFCLSSKYAGATVDLIEDGANGLIINPTNIIELSEKIDESFSYSIDKEKIKSSFTVSPKNEATKIYKAIMIAREKG